MNLGRSLLLTMMSLSACSFLPGCASLTPYEEVAARIPPERLVEIGDHRVHVEQEGEGDPLLLLHGFAASTYSFREITPLLTPGLRTVSIDLHGFGFTERPGAAQAYGVDGQIEMINGVMAALEIERCAIVGHSYGAALALLLAERNPERVRSLVLVSPAAEFEKPPWYLRLAPGRLAAYGMTRALLSRPSQFRKILGNAFHQKEKLTPAVVEAYRKRLLVEGLPDAFRGFTRDLSGADTLAFEFAKIEAPTLVIAGRHDAVIDLAQSRRVADALPRGELKIFEESGHSAPEEQPEAVVAAILAHLESAP